MRSAFTLVEVLVTLMVASLVMGSAVSVFILQHGVGSAHQGTQAAQLAGQVTMEMLERDLRMAGYHTDRSSALQIINNVPAGDPEARTGSDAVFISYSTTSASRYRWFVAPAGGLYRRSTITNQTELVAPEIDDLQIVSIPIDPLAGSLQLRLALVARSSRIDPNFLQVPPQPADSPARPADNYRRRVFTTTVVPRNYGL